MHERSLHGDFLLVILRDLRLGKFDVLVGINLLREGLDLPEVSVVAILDADNQGFLRSQSTLIQIAGRAARNVNGRVTVASENNLAIIWHITRADRSATSDDIIGLVAQNLVQIYHPVSNWGAQRRAGPNHSSQYFYNPQIDAAILSVTGSFLVPNWNEGIPLGDISVNGAIAQVFRGPVGLVNGSTGYFKDYVYDQRFLYQSPPHFIDPVEGQWEVAVYSECPGGTCT